MITGRQAELNLLETIYHLKGEQIVLVTGEKYVGKTALIREFSVQHNGIYLSACNASLALNKLFFVKEIQMQCSLSISETLQDWNSVIQELLKKSSGNRVILIIDNIQYILEIVGEILQLLHNWKSQQTFPVRLMIVFAGDVTEENCEFIRKITGTEITVMKLKPLTFLEAMPYYNTVFTDDEKILLYGVTGGFPGFLNLIEPGKSFRDNLYKMFFETNAYMFRCGRDWIERRVRQPAVYHAILYAIASGKVRLGEIAEEVGIDYNKLSKYIGSLLNMGIIERIIPADEKQINKQHKRTFYIIRNNMLLFWYHFVFPVQSSIQTGAGKKILRTEVLSQLDTYAQKIFFDVCFQYCEALKQKGNFSMNFQNIGYFWKQEISLDKMFLIAFNTRQYCLMKCLWDKQKVSVRQLQEMEEEGPTEFVNKEVFNVVFSRKGFTGPALQYSAKHPKIRLISLYYMK